MPNLYRAPGVILKSSWDYNVNIWNVAMVVIVFHQALRPFWPWLGSSNIFFIQTWDIVSSRTLINGRNPDGIFDDRVHLAELVALIAPPPFPPLAFCQRCHLSSVSWDESVNWKELNPIPNRTSGSLAANIDGEDVEGFLLWMRMALQWNPEDPPTAQGLLFDKWLMKGLGEKKIEWLKSNSEFRSVT